MPTLLKSHTVQLSTALIIIATILADPAVQAMLSPDLMKYVTVVLAVAAILRKYNQSNQ